jgi:hypothetical protein
MSTTVGEVFNLTMDLMDERNDAGSLTESDVVGYRVKTFGILNILQAELLKQGDIYSTYSISNKPAKNELGFNSNFNVEEFVGIDKTYETDSISKAYYFEADNEGTVYIEDYTGSWNVLATINTTIAYSGFLPYKGVVTPTTGATRSRIRFSGTNYYRHVNRALFNIPFVNSSSVPDYRPWVKKDMPSDFKSVDQIVSEYVDLANNTYGQYAKDANYKWEGRNSLYMDYYFEGNMRVVYHPIPNLLTFTGVGNSTIDLSQTLTVDDITARNILPYGVASHLLLVENSASASFFNQRYEELKFQSTRQQPASAEQIINIYGGI